MRRRNALGLVLGGTAVFVSVASAAVSGDVVPASAGIADDTGVASSEAVVALGVFLSLVTAFVTGAILRRAVSAVGDRSDEPRAASETGGVEVVEAESRVAAERLGRSDGRVAATDSAADAEASPEVPELLSDEEHVVGLLEANDGRLGQSEIVGLTPWSKSKVSRVLTRMDDRGDVVKVSTGRQNVIFVPGEEPAELKPPEKQKQDDDGPNGRT